MFPVLFAIGRTPGWLAQWQEGLLDPEQKIARPRQVYTGPAERHLPGVRATTLTLPKRGREDSRQ
jgi:citrate synthase